MTIKESHTLIYERAIELVNQGWCGSVADALDKNGREVAPNSPDACKWSAGGALKRACIEYARKSEWEKVRREFAHWIGCRFIGIWNDRVERREVVAALTLAWKEARGWPNMRPRLSMPEAVSGVAPTKPGIFPGIEPAPAPSKRRIREDEHCSDRCHFPGLTALRRLLAVRPLVKIMNYVAPGEINGGYGGCTVAIRGKKQTGAIMPDYFNSVGEDNVWVSFCAHNREVVNDTKQPAWEEGELARLDAEIYSFDTGCSRYNNAGREVTQYGISLMADIPESGQRPIIKLPPMTATGRERERLIEDAAMERARWWAMNQRRLSLNDFADYVEEGRRIAAGQVPPAADVAAWERGGVSVRFSMPAEDVKTLATCPKCGTDTAEGGTIMREIPGGGLADHCLQCGKAIRCHCNRDPQMEGTPPEPCERCGGWREIEGEIEEIVAGAPRLSMPEALPALDREPRAPFGVGREWHDNGNYKHLGDFADLRAAEEAFLTAMRGGGANIELYEVGRGLEDGRILMRGSGFYCTKVRNWKKEFKRLQTVNFSAAEAHKIIGDMVQRARIVRAIPTTLNGQLEAKLQPKVPFVLDESILRIYREEKCGEIARDCLKLIADGWTQGAEARNKSGEPCKPHCYHSPAEVSAEGAIAYVAHNLAAQDLRDEMIRRVAGAAGANDLGEWNDAPGRTVEEVAAAFRAVEASAAAALRPAVRLSMPEERDEVWGADIDAMQRAYNPPPAKKTFPWLGCSTPWGEADEVIVVASGIVEVGTPGHGGIWLSAARAKRIPGAGIPEPKGGAWFEEDLDYNIAIALHPAPFSKRDRGRGSGDGGAKATREAALRRLELFYNEGKRGAEYAEYRVWLKAFRRALTGSATPPAGGPRPVHFSMPEYDEQGKYHPCHYCGTPTGLLVNGFSDESGFGNVYYIDRTNFRTDLNAAPIRAHPGCLADAEKKWAARAPAAEVIKTIRNEMDMRSAPVLDEFLRRVEKSPPRLSMPEPPAAAGWKNYWDLCR